MLKGYGQLMVYIKTDDIYLVIAKYVKTRLDTCKIKR